MWNRSVLQRPHFNNEMLCRLFHTNTPPLTIRACGTRNATQRDVMVYRLATHTTKAFLTYVFDNCNCLHAVSVIQWPSARRNSLQFKIKCRKYNSNHTSCWLNYVFVEIMSFARLNWSKEKIQKQIPVIEPWLTIQNNHCEWSMPDISAIFKIFELNNNVLMHMNIRHIRNTFIKKSETSMIFEWNNEITNNTDQMKRLNFYFKKSTVHCECCTNLDDFIVNFNVLQVSRFSHILNSKTRTYARTHIDNADYICRNACTFFFVVHWVNVSLSNESTTLWNRYWFGSVWHNNIHSPQDIYI